MELQLDWTDSDLQYQDSGESWFTSHVYKWPKCIAATDMTIAVFWKVTLYSLADRYWCFSEKNIAPIFWIGDYRTQWGLNEQANNEVSECGHKNI